MIQFWGKCVLRKDEHLGAGLGLTYLSFCILLY
jgi:hypothetical protein